MNINWDKAPEGATHWDTEADVFCSAFGYWHKGEFITIRSHLDWGTDRYAPKPVYTQEMCDNGELPPVGSECLFDDIHGNVFFKRFKDKTLVIVGRDDPYDGVSAAIFRYEHEGEPAYHACVARKFKPLPPKVELEDGKAYQFDYEESTKTGSGTYDCNGKCFWVKGTPRVIGSCTNIIPLLPKEM